MLDTLNCFIHIFLESRKGRTRKKSTRRGRKAETGTRGEVTERRRRKSGTKEGEILLIYTFFNELCCKVFELEASKAVFDITEITKFSI